MSHPHPSDPHPPDGDLVGFLKQHRPQVPPAPSDLEDSLMTCIEVIESTSVRARPRHSRSGIAWLLPPAIAAAAIASWFVARPAPQLADAELAELEADLVSSWQMTTEGTAGRDGDAIGLFALDDTGDW